MAKTKKKTSKKKTQDQEQLDLIDVHPKNSKEIIRVAKLYKKAQRTRINALEEEKQLKQQVLELIKKENLQPTADGQIKFTIDEFTISITPRDELVKVKEVEDEAA